MPIQTTYTKARAQFSSLCDEVANNREVVIIKRRGFEDVVLISAVELTGLLETCHLMSSPKNTERLMAAFERSMKQEGEPQTIGWFKEEVGLAGE